ncbi:DNA methyltransferase [Dictyobacter arantiisoli]|uniref:Methyltransferase n=1 Tax=Dictyobacter arantiisoli TaxID=2014874 RepID=A0A5A5TJI8_9CHLR|nr:DNA methyltransferase [Dictyobacter arantiisoli]GCF11398.1 hypothetical protein KDI_49620 [Dictyobacter arantiisoli]
MIIGADQDLSERTVSGAGWCGDSGGVVDWSFASLKRHETVWGPHGYHRYPAKFIPQLVRQIIERYSDPGDLVGDTFVGSATTGVEALRSGRRFWGSDINPVALLISRAKCQPLSPEALCQDWECLSVRLKTVRRIGRRALTEREIEEIQGINIAHATDEERFTYWFPQAYREVLEAILFEIMSCTEAAYQTFYLCSFSNILKRTSIWLSGSTKPQKDLGKYLADPVEEFQKQTRDMVKRNTLYWKDLERMNFDPAWIFERYGLELADARHLPLEAEMLDFLVTSPPYATCYEYSELHQLTYLWLNRYHIFSQAPGLASYYIGSRGGTRRKKSEEQLALPLPPSAHIALEQLLTKVKGVRASAIVREAEHLTNYFHDMYAALREANRVLVTGKKMVLIIGNTYRRGVMIPTSSAIGEMARELGFDLEQRIVRKIPARILVSTRDMATGRFSSNAQSDSQAYPEEDILVFCKRSHCS